MRVVTRRAMSITPMIDVVFLLLLFFLLTTQLTPTVSIPVGVANAGSANAEEPLLLEIEAGGTLFIQGKPAEIKDWQAALQGAPRALAIRPGGVSVETLIDFVDQARAQGWENITLVEGSN